MSDESITSLPDAVAVYGALPVPVASEPQAPVVDPRIELIRKERTHCEAAQFESEDDRLPHAWGPSQYPKREMCQRCTVSREWAEDPEAADVVLLAEVDRLGSELAAFRALELGAPDGRVSAACGNPEHPTWLRKPEDARACPWCRIAALEGRLHDAAMTRVWKNEDGKSFVFVEDIAPALLDLPREAPLSGPTAEDSCTCPPTPRPHQVGCPLDGVLAASPDERPVNGLTATFAPVSSLREPEPEFHAWLHHENRLGHDPDWPGTGGVQ